MSNLPIWEKLTASVAETCAASGFGKSTVWEMISDGTLGSTKVNGRRLVIVPSLLKLLGMDRQSAAAALGATGERTQPGKRRRGRPPKHPVAQQVVA